jgi:hypothetical protein
MPYNQLIVVDLLTLIPAAVAKLLRHAAQLQIIV